jgi:serine/threonine-protein kinase
MRANDPALAPTAGVDHTVTDLRVGSPAHPDEGGDDLGLAPGELLSGRYRVTRFIARGGMSEVYEAHDALLGDAIAVKLLRPALARKPGAQERFAQEIRLARKITHANVCRVFDVGVDGDRIYFTMELHPGATLASRLREHGALSIAQASPLIQQLLDGIAAAHAAGIVHQDLKPSNVLLAGERVVLTDFGLAVPCCATLGCDCSMPHLINTPAYMAPEQVTGGTILDCTDLFAVGVILFEVLTGTLPWKGANPAELATARLSGDVPSPRAVRPDLDPTWDAAIRSCLAREAAERPRSVGELRNALGL